MNPDLRITPMQWLAAGVAALALHGVLLLTLGRLDPGTGAADRQGAPQTRLRLTLSRPARPAAAPVAASEHTRTAPADATSPTRAAIATPPEPRPVRTPSAATRPTPPAPLPSKRSADPTAATPSTLTTPGASEPPAQTATAALTTVDSATTSAQLGDLEAAAARGATASGTDSGGSRSDGRARVDYFDALFARVVATLDYPRRARLDEIEGTVLLGIRIDRQGEIAQCEVTESSGSPLLDRHAMRIARRAAPFGAVPDSLPEEALGFDLPLEFLLTR